MRKILAGPLAVAGTLLAIGAARAQTFGEYYGFGDSLTDNGRIGRLGARGPSAINPRLYREDRWSNGPVFFELVPERIGAPYRVENDYAIGGAVSGFNVNPAVPPFTNANLPQLQDQVSQFIGGVGRLNRGDLANIWIGYNDISRIPLTATPAQREAGIAAILNNTALTVTRLAEVGGREFVVFNQQSFRANRGDVAAEINARLPGTLEALQSTGANVRLFDVDSLILRLRANPTAFGYNPDANTPCSLVPSCVNGGFDAQNGYISPDGVHLTGRTNTYIADFLANQLNAPRTVAAQTALGQGVARSFSNSLLDRLDAQRWSAAGRALLPAAAPAGTRTPLADAGGNNGPFAAFVYGTYTNPDSADRYGNPGLDADLGAVTVGGELQLTPNLMLGGAFNYTGTDADLRARGGGKVDIDSYQIGVFAALAYPSFFLDGAVTYGWNDYDLSRPGVLDTLRASPDGNTFTAAARTGYLFDLGGFRLGPIAGLSYVNASVDSYREGGDPLLTIGVRRQNLDGLTGSAGLQARTAFAAGTARVSPYLNLTAEQDFRDDARTVSTFQTYAPGLVIRTRAGRGNDDTFGRVAGGASVDFASGIGVFALASTTFGRTAGEDTSVSGGLRYRF